MKAPAEDVISEKVEQKPLTLIEMMENVEEHSLKLKNEILGQRQPSKNLLSTLENFINVMKTEKEKQKKLESEEFSCPHVNKPKIAKGMCFNCYNKKGKTKKATKCEHTDMPLYC